MHRTAEDRAYPRAWSLALSAVMIGSCAPANPSEADGSRVVQHQVEQEGKGLVRLVSFKKTNGQRAGLFAVRTYTMEYSARIEFVKDACYGGGLSARDYHPPRYDQFGLPMYEDSHLACYRVHVAKGERRDVTGFLSFEQTERGWRGPDGQRY